MEEKKVTKISLSTFFLIISLVVIIVMGIFMYKFYNEKTDNISETISFTDEQIKEAFANYLEIKATNGGKDLLEWLTEKGNLNYDSSKDNELDNGMIITNIKFSDYKNAMLNYVSENEFEKNWKSPFFGEDTQGNLITANGGGSNPVYTIKNITKISDMNYTAQISYIVDESAPTPSYDKNFSFTISSYNSNCVIDSFKEID